MNDILNDTTCPDERELAEFVADPLKEEWADLAAHVETCDRCRDSLAAIIARDEPVVTTPEEDAFIAEFTAKNCRRRESDAERIQAFIDARRMAFVTEPVQYSLAAAPAGGAAAVASPRAPDEEIRFVYAAAGADSAESWRAELLIPSGATPETMLGVTVTGGDRHLVSDGVLRLAGCSLPLSQGAASLPFSLFLEGLRDTDVSLVRAGHAPVAGRLLFF